MINGSRSHIKDRVSISERPDHINKRITFGHWEMDLIIGKSHRGVLFTIVERKSRFTLSIKVANKSADCRIRPLHVLG